MDIIAYKQGQQWILNCNGKLIPLHYSIKTKSEVRKHVEEYFENFLGKVSLIFA